MYQGTCLGYYELTITLYESYPCVGTFLHSFHDNEELFLFAHVYIPWYMVADHD